VVCVAFVEVNYLRYDSDLTDKEWEIIEPIFTKAKKGKHLQKHNKRELVNAVRYLSKTGCQWRMLPKEYPAYQTVYSFYNRAVKSGLWEEMTDLLVQMIRLEAKRNAKPSYALIDSQSVKTTSASKDRGFDGGKKSKVANGT
jgi:putative transposase